MRGQLQEKILKIERQLENNSDQKNTEIFLLMNDFLELYKLGLNAEDPRISWINQRLYEIRKVKGTLTEKPLAVVHIIPNNSFGENVISLNLPEFYKKQIPMLGEEYGNPKRANYHGILQKDTDSEGYTQIYRNGIIELTSTKFWDQYNRFYPFHFENCIIKTIEEYTTMMNDTLKADIQVHITLLNVKDCRFFIPRILTEVHKINQDEIQLPSFTIETDSDNLIKDKIAPSLEVLWNAGGFVKSLPKSKFL
ncbi:hypothetical protein P4629_11650 [Priestia aryabhattai]|uniref:hypothetical protein n=1 Tax=Priestia aryabhattai TaxID=412384 RepID=UPI002E2432FD|nr:hypothetical protein [Priestia aryabhattai]